MDEYVSAAPPALSSPRLTCVARLLRRTIELCSTARDTATWASSKVTSPGADGSTTVPIMLTI